MNNSKDQKLQEELRRREYLKQQQQLRNMTKPKTNLSADAMIENLLSKKEIFQRKSSNSTSQTQILNIPPMYQSIWNWCKIAGSAELADTAKISALLITSRLPTDALGYIWSLANQTVPGSLTQQEVFTTLALVALAQSGYSFRSIAVVNQLGRFPIPILDMSLVSGPSCSASAPPVKTPTTPTVPTLPTPPANLVQVSPFSQNPSTSSQGADDDEFDDFKSADLSSLNVENLKVLEMSSAKSSLMRFDSPKRPPPALSILESPTKEPPGALTVLDMPLADDNNTGRRNSPEQLSVLDLPLTETSHQPPFNTAVIAPPMPVSLSAASAIPIEPPAPINSISGSVDSPTRDSPSHPVDDLFPKCVIKRSFTSDLLDWDSSPSNEEYLTCDLSSNKIEINSGQLPNDSLVDVKMITAEVSEGIKEIKLDCPPSLTDVFPISSESQILDADSEFDSFKSSDFIPAPELPENSTKRELNLSDFEPKVQEEASSKNFPSLISERIIHSESSFLDMDDKYSALRGLETKGSDDFGDFITAEPVNLLSDAPLVPQITIQEQCMEAVFGLLHQAISSFKSIHDEKVLIEVLDDQRCKKYLEELGEVYNVGDRLCKLKEMSAKKTELDQLWDTLAGLTRQALPQTRKLPSEDCDTVRCGVCLQESGVNCQIGYAMNHFHPACANLYLNRVSGASLPLQ